MDVILVFFDVVAVLLLIDMADLAWELGRRETGALIFGSIDGQDSIESGTQPAV